MGDMIPSSFLATSLGDVYKAALPGNVQDAQLKLNFTFKKEYFYCKNVPNMV